MAKSNLRKKFTKSEWMEFYVFMKLLGEGKIHSADKFYKRKPNCDLSVIKILRNTREGEILEYVVDTERTLIVIGEQDGEFLILVPMRDFAKYAELLLQTIRKERGAFAAPAPIAAFMKKIYAEAPKAPAIRGTNRKFNGRNTLILEARNDRKGTTALMGFSVKTSVGRGMFFEGGPFSQMLFRMKGCGDKYMQAYNHIVDENGNPDWEARKEFLYKYRFGLKPACALDPAFDRNMSLANKAAYAVVAWCVRDMLLVTSEGHGVMETVNRMTAANPYGMLDANIAYESVMKDFLFAVFSGMAARRLWWKEPADGGYLFVTDDDVVGFHTEDRGELCDYLYKNTAFEFVGLEKGDWGGILKNGSEYFLELNFSIRFEQNLC